MKLKKYFTPQGFIALRYFAFLPVILGIYGSVSGSGLLAADEERGILDFVLAHPVSRGQLFWGRVVAFTVSLSCIIGFGWLGLWIGVAKAESMNFSPVPISASVSVSLRCDLVLCMFQLGAEHVCSVPFVCRNDIRNSCFGRLYHYYFI